MNVRPQLIAVVLGLVACKGETGIAGNSGSQGARGQDGPAGTPGAIGAEGTSGMDGANGLGGGTPVLLTNPIDGVIQYGDGDNVISLGSHTLVAPANGGFQLRIHYRGTVAKRDGIGFCRVAIRVRRNDELNPFLEQIVGIHGAPVAGKLDLSVGGTILGLVQLPAQDTLTLHMEMQRFDGRCADGAGPTQIARIAAQLDVSFHTFGLEFQ